MMDGIKENPAFYYRPYGEEGSGYYSQHTQCMHVLYDELTPLVLDEIDKIPLNRRENRPFTICDFGTSDGGTVVKLLSKSIGGRMVFCLPTVDERGRYPGFTCSGTKDMYKFSSELFRQMVNKGQISEAEFKNILFYHYYRTVDELNQPFTDTSSTVYKAGLRMSFCETKIIPCPFHGKWMAEGKKGDVQAMRAHAKSYVPNLRSWMNSQLVVGLSENRPISEREAIIDEFFKMFEDDVALNPELHKVDVVVAVTVIEKVHIK